MRIRCVLLLGPLLVLPLAACGAADPGDTSNTVPSVSSDPSFTAVPLTPSASPAPTGSVPPELAGSPEVQAAVADLASRLDVPADQIEVVEVSEVTWPDTSLGCPKAGMSYPQVLTNGQRVILSTAGWTYEYHSGPSRPLFYCPNPSPAMPGGGAGAGTS